MESEIVQESINNLPQIVLISVLLVTIIGIFLGFTKRAIYFNDYNDLGITAAVFAAPAAILLITAQFGLLQEYAIWVTITIFSILFCLVLYRTWVANDGSIMKTIIVSISKLVMSFLYVFYLFQALTGKKRRDRGQAWFILAIFTPLLVALVHTQEGKFRLSSRGRPLSASSGRSIM